MKTTFKNPDLNAPRFRPSKHVVLTKKLYKKFLEAYPDHDISYEMFKNIIGAYNKNLIKGAIDNRSGIELPENLGYVFLASCEKPKKQNIDIAKSKKYGVIANHKNWDSDNKLLKIFFVNKNSHRGLTYKGLWAFKPIRNFKRTASKAFIENWNKYISIAAHIKPSSLFYGVDNKKYISKEINPNIFTVVPDGYDEFNM
jgi:hypothetical protein